ncbi:MAG: hypothetical protein K6C11_04490 [Bacilli bacterium]|nr:hypothetical protein [Bacilli bacterium]
MNESERKKIFVTGNILLQIVKWIVLIFAVLTAGLTIGLIVTTVLYGNNITIDNIKLFTSFLLPYSDVEVKTFVTLYGMEKVLIASLGYSVASVISKILLYALMVKSIKLFEAITIGDVFSKKTVSLSGEIISISFMATFLMPIILFIISTTTSLFNDLFLSVDFSGLFFLVGALVVNIILTRGESVVRVNNKYDRTIDDYKADIDELKIQSIKREAELKELKKLVKKEEVKQIEAKVQEDVQANTDEAPKKRKRHHSRAKKGTTTK